MKYSSLSSKRIEKIKQVLGKSYSVIANDLGVAAGTLYQISNGSDPISQQMAERICSTYPQFSFDWVFKGEGEMLAAGGVVNGGNNSGVQIGGNNSGIVGNGNTQNSIPPHTTTFSEIIKQLTDTNAQLAETNARLVKMLSNKE